MVDADIKYTLKRLGKLAGGSGEAILTVNSSGVVTLFVSGMTIAQQEQPITGTSIEGVFKRAYERIAENNEVAA